ncbi:MAG TPA: alpha-amylase/4-alpha-glucanotransferase domain-containing protein, partial [Candidatus Kapabacteria bacterium]|nr:alpha-amylase/4-alpha-glucanotransferase domain-containing protein [Candidatus Kapabacteria bacterium]
MKTVTFCFATHNHQPIGNFDSVFEEAYEKSYKPFFEIAKNHPVKFATHFSGILLEWITNHHPEHIALLKEQVSSGNLEIISGGYYEPILAVIPDRDKAAQIGKLTEAIKRSFGYEPTGLWLAERVWEQQLAAPLAESGITYVVLDDTHFRAAGLTDSDLNGYYLTEDQGKIIAVFPISKELRYTIPFQSVDETIKVLRDAASEAADSIVTFADDGEKFGVWPRTFEHVYGEGWLEEFFTKLEENSSWIRTMHFSEALTQHKPKGRLYLPNASYAEMMEWALPSAGTMLKYETFVSLLDADKKKFEEYKQFVRGGFWRNFFVKYPESNHLHKRMQEVSNRCEALQFPQPAYDHLLAAQCND